MGSRCPIPGQHVTEFVDRLPKLRMGKNLTAPANRRPGTAGLPKQPGEVVSWPAAGAGARRAHRAHALRRVGGWVTRGASSRQAGSGCSASTAARLWPWSLFWFSRKQDLRVSSWMRNPAIFCR